MLSARWWQKCLLSTSLKLKMKTAEGLFGSSWTVFIYADMERACLECQKVLHYVSNLNNA